MRNGWINLIYILTIHGRHTLSEAERSELHESAERAYFNLAPAATQILGAATDKIALLRADDICRLAFESLQRVRVWYIKLIPPQQLVNLIIKCNDWCTAVESRDMGSMSKDDMVCRLLELSAVSASIEIGVMDAIKSGELEVRDGLAVRKS